jgi:hypothetical protein
MSGTVWILFALGTWLVVMSTVYICAGLVKDVDRAQSDVLARGRRDRFVDPRPHQRAI